MRLSMITEWGRTLCLPFPFFPSHFRGGIKGEVPFCRNFPKISAPLCPIFFANFGGAPGDDAGCHTLCALRTDGAQTGHLGHCGARGLERVLLL